VDRDSNPFTVNCQRGQIDREPESERATVHDLYVRIQGGQLQLVNEFSGTTQDMLVLNWSPSQSLVGVTSIRVMTTASPSWVGWREIEILSGDTSEPAITSAVNGASFDASITPGSWVTIQGAAWPLPNERGNLPTSTARSCRSRSTALVSASTALPRPSITSVRHS